MNLIEVHGVNVIVDYCHNAPGMRMLGDFVESFSAQKAGSAELGKASRIGMIATAGDRRDEDMRELGAVGGRALRRDHRPRGPPAARPRSAGDGRRAGRRGRPGQDGRGRPRCRQVEIVLEELDAVRHCMARANPGDLVVLCVDHHATVLAELEQMTSSAQAGAHEGSRPGDPDLDPRALQDAAEATAAAEAATPDR